jgi:hypothetical protein
MYAGLNRVSGAQGVNELLATIPVASSPDGLTLDTAKAPLDSVAAMPDRLWNWLLDLRLLRHVPLSYLVPDSALLPPESIRFFHVDLSWIDRILDGVFSAANTGTVDIAFSAAMLQVVRRTLDDALADQAVDAAPGNSNKWSPAAGMTGMLIRSELVRRWPDMIVSAFSVEAIPPGTPKPTSPPESARLPVLRAEPISSDIYIALFGGTPALVQVREPHVGVRFGMEQDPQDKHFFFLNADGFVNPDKSADPTETKVAFSDQQYRVLPITGPQRQTNCGLTPSAVAMNLARLPFIQQFQHSVTEDRGSAPPVGIDGVLKLIPLRNGRTMNLQGLAARFSEQQRLEKI